MSESEEYKKLFEELMKSRDLIESSLKQTILEMEQMGVSPNDSLLDSEGFPRVDVDLYRARALKSAIVRQQNDHKELMKRIEYVLPKVIPSQSHYIPVQRTLKPFAKIGIVPTESSAFKAGLCPNDLIVKFGDLTIGSFSNDLKSVSSEFSRFKAEGFELEIKVKRSDTIKSFVFDCKIIESIGCQILPL